MQRSWKLSSRIKTSFISTTRQTYRLGHWGPGLVPGVLPRKHLITLGAAEWDLGPNFYWNSKNFTHFISTCLTQPSVLGISAHLSKKWKLHSTAWTLSTSHFLKSGESQIASRIAYDEINSQRETLFGAHESWRLSEFCVASLRSR